MVWPNLKTIFLIRNLKALFILIAVFFVLPLNSLAGYPENQLGNPELVELKDVEAQKILNSLISKIQNKWIDITASPDMKIEDQAVLSVIRTGTKSKVGSYFLFEYPKNITIKVGTTIFKLAKFAITDDPSILINEIETLTANKAKEYIFEFLNKNNIKISVGNLPVKYTNYEYGKENFNIPYIVAYKEVDSQTAEISIAFYSHNSLKAPITDIKSQWEGGLNNLNPFILKIKGRVERFSGVYIWQSEPEFQFIYNEEVPEFDFKEPGFWDGVKSYIKKLNPFNFNLNISGGASLVSDIDNYYDNPIESGQAVADPAETERFNRQLAVFRGKFLEILNLLGKKIEPVDKNKPVEDNAGIDYDKIQEQLDDIAEKLDILSAEAQKLGIIIQKDKKEESEDEAKSLGSDSGKEYINYPKILITEVATRGANGSKDEFVELYNPNSENVILTGWYLQRKTGSNPNFSSYASKNLFENKVIVANGYLLITRAGASSYSSLSDIATINPLSLENSLALKNPNGEINDEVGWEAENEANKSISRKWPDQAASYIDSDDYRADFDFMPPSPKKKNSYEQEIKDPETSQNLGFVISEIQIEGDEFVELYNPNNSDIDISNYYFSYYSPLKLWNDPYRNKKFPDNTILPKNGHYLIGIEGYPPQNGNPNSDWQIYESPQFNNSSGAVAIFPFDPKTKTEDEAKIGKIDAVGWGGSIVYEEGAIKEFEINKSLSRKSEDGELFIDTDNNISDFVVSELTPTNSKGEGKYRAIFANMAWPNFQKDEKHSGMANLTINPQSQLSINWEKEVSSIDPQLDIFAKGKVIVGPEDIIYAITSETIEPGILGRIYALNPDSEILWQYSNFIETPRHIAASGDGKVYVATDSKIYAFDYRTGNNDWVYSEEEISSIGGITIDNKTGYIYFTDYYNLYSIDNKGKKKWKANGGTGGSADAGVVIGEDGTIYAVWTGFINLTNSGLGTLATYNPDGSQKWSFALKYGLASAPVISGNNIYVSYGDEGYITNQRRIAKIDAATGNLVWQSEQEEGSVSMPIIFEDGRIIFFDNSKKIVRLYEGIYNVTSPISKAAIYDVRGQNITLKLYAENSIESPAIIGNDFAIAAESSYKDIGWTFVPDKSYLTAYFATGEINSQDLPGRAVSNLAVSDDGRIYFLGYKDGKTKIYSASYLENNVAEEEMKEGDGFEDDELMAEFMIGDLAASAESFGEPMDDEEFLEVFDFEEETMDILEGINLPEVDAETPLVADTEPQVEEGEIIEEEIKTEEPQIEASEKI